MIEWVNDGVLDSNGWDLKKTLMQVAKGNDVLFESSASPVVYETTEEWVDVCNAAEAYVSE